MPARIESWGGDKILNAKVRRIEPTGFTKVSALGIEEQRVKVILDFTGPPTEWRQLGHGYRVIARVVVWHSDDALQVPLGALFREGDNWAVFVAADRPRGAPVDQDRRTQPARGAGARRSERRRAGGPAPERPRA